MGHLKYSVRVWSATGICLILTTFLTLNIIQLNTEKEELEKENEKLNNNISDLEKENDNLTNELLNTNEKLAKAEQKLKQIKKELKKTNEKNKELNKEIEEKNNKIKKLEKPKVQVSSETVKSGNGKTMTMNTSYFTMNCNGCTGRTASGYKLSKGQTTVDGYTVVAADTNIIPLHSVIKITNPDGSSYKAKVMDRGGAIKGHKLDVLVGSKDVANKKGRHSTTVEVLSYGDNKYRKVN